MELTDEELQDLYTWVRLARHPDTRRSWRSLQALTALLLSGG